MSCFSNNYSFFPFLMESPKTYILMPGVNGAIYTHNTVITHGRTGVPEWVWPVAMGDRNRMAHKHHSQVPLCDARTDTLPDPGCHGDSGRHGHYICTCRPLECRRGQGGVWAGLRVRMGVDGGWPCSWIWNEVFHSQHYFFSSSAPSPLSPGPAPQLPSHTQHPGKASSGAHFSCGLCLYLCLLESLSACGSRCVRFLAQSSCCDFFLMIFLFFPLSWVSFFLCPLSFCLSLLSSKHSPLVLSHLESQIHL